MTHVICVGSDRIDRFLFAVYDKFQIVATKKRHAVTPRIRGMTDAFQSATKKVTGGTNDLAYLTLSGLSGM